MKIGGTVEHVTENNAAPTRAECDMALYYGDAIRIARQALHSDERIMCDCMDRVQVSDAVKQGAHWRQILMQNGKPAPLTDDQAERAQRMAARRMEIRDRIMETCGLSGSWDYMAGRVQRQPRRLAAVLQAAGVLRALPASAPLAKRRTLTEDEMDRKAKAAEAWAQEAVG